MTKNNQLEQNKSTAHTDLDLAWPFLKFLHEKWWRVDMCGFDALPDSGPALIVGNTSGQIPWPALMFIYSLTIAKPNRIVHIVTDIDHIKNERVEAFLRSLNFMPWSYDNAKELIEKGELVLAFPEDSAVVGKTINSRNRLAKFDWTKFLPAIERATPIYPLVTLGIDEANLVIHNSEFLSRLLELKSFPVSPFFPWLPFPFNLATAPVSWKMQILPALTYTPPNDRNAAQDQAKKIALRAEGEIQAQINRLLRARSRYF